MKRMQTNCRRNETPDQSGKGDYGAAGIGGHRSFPDLIRDMDQPKPHYNTVSTIVRSLEEKGFVGHERFGTTYRYFPLLSREEFGRMSLQNAVGKYFNRSYLSVLSMFVEEKKITPEEIKELIRQVEAGSQNEKP